jgi:hypothetical protein
MSEETLDTSIKIAVAVAATESMIERALKALEQHVGLPVIGLALDNIEVTQMQDEGRRFLRRVQISVAAWDDDVQEETQTPERPLEPCQWCGTLVREQTERPADYCVHDVLICARCAQVYPPGCKG